MNRLLSNTRLFVVFSLLLHAICPVSLWASTPPVISSLGSIREGLIAPTRITLDSQGNLYVADARQKAVIKLDMYGKRLGMFQGSPVSGGGIAATRDGKRLYVADRTSVAILDAVTGEALGKVGAGPGEFQYVYDLEVDAAGYLYVGDAGARLVKIYDPKGAFLNSIGGVGTTPGKFWNISDIAVHGATGEIYVADPSASSTIMVPKVQVFSSGGTLLRTLLGSNGFGSPALSYFSGMTFDAAGRFYVSDSLLSRIVALRLPTGYLSAYAVVGFKPGQLQGPRDIKFDPATGRLFVVCEDGRVEIFGIDGAKNPVRVNRPPTPPSLLSPIGGSETNSAKPELVFRNATDPDGDKLTYAVRVLKDGGIAAEIGGIAPGQEMTTASLGIALAENTRYEWMAQARDGEAASEWTSAQSFWVNAVEEPPGSPSPISPVSGESLDGKGPLRWQEAADPDPFDQVEYLVEISAEPTFKSPVISEQVKGTSQLLEAFSSYAALEDATTYFWRVIAVDGHGLRSEPGAIGDFVYDTTVLKVASNFPKAQVYLGGNLAYPGRFLGETPLVLKDFPHGTASVVVERSGFEPFIAQIHPLYRENVSVSATLVPAILPGDLKSRPLEAGGSRLRLTSAASPFLVDFDNDGHLDLLTGDGAGGVTLFHGSKSSTGELVFGAGIPLHLPLVPGASPFVVDWDNDGRKDLLLGGSNGTVLLFQNSGTEGSPTFGEGVLIQEGGAPISLGAPAVPCVADLNGDGAKDLIVGSGNGEVLFYENHGNDAAPLLSRGVRLMGFPTAAAPFFADWDGNGEREMLVATGDAIHRALPRQDGSWATVESISPVSGLLKSKGSPDPVLGYLKMFSCDLDGKSGKDLVLGTGGGEVFFLPSSGRTLAPSYQEALQGQSAGAK